jgi:hypothetical protein
MQCGVAVGAGIAVGSAGLWGCSGWCGGGIFD